MAGLNAVEPGEVLLHVGVHKTGTTAVQVALADAREQLAAHGVRYPGTGNFHHRAVLAGADRRYGWQNNGARELPRQYWDELVTQCAWDGRTVVSSEFLDDVDEATARRMIDDLGGPQRVRVVVTLRSIGAILPSAWQQRLKIGFTGTYGQFLKMVFAENQTPKAQRFWFRHDQDAQVRRWAGIVGTDRTCAVIIPDGDRRAIFAAFEELLALPSGLLADRTVTIQNRSMTAQEAEFMRRVNKQVAGKLTWDEYNRTVRRGLVLNMVEQRRPEPGEQRILTPAWAADRAAEVGARFAEGISASGVHVIGDPQELARRPKSASSQRPTSLTMDAAVAAAVGLVQRSAASATPPEPTRGQALRVLLGRRGRPRAAATEPVDPETP